MKTWERRIVPVGLGVAGALFLLAALKPMITRQPLNVAFLVIGIVCLILGLGLLRKRDGDASPPSM